MIEESALAVAIVVEWTVENGAKLLSLPSVACPEPPGGESRTSWM